MPLIGTSTTTPVKNVMYLLSDDQSVSTMPAPGVYWNTSSASPVPSAFLR